MVTFTKAQIESFSEEERQLFDNLAQRAHAGVVDGENSGFDVKKRKSQDAEEEGYRNELEKSFV